MNDPDIIAAARRTVPSLTDEQWTDWLAQVERMGGSISLPFDGGPCVATYPRKATPCPQNSAMDQSE